jgi:penicillin-binding protein 2
MHREADRWRAFSRRTALLAGGQLGLLGLLAGRLYDLQVLEADQYALLADENRINHRLLPPARGRIFDRHGVAMARNVPTYRVRIVPEQAGEIRRTLSALARLIDLPAGRIDAVLAEARARRSFVPITVREDLVWDEVARIAVRAPELPGVSLDAGLVRQYPSGRAAAHLLGYVGPVSASELNGDPLLELPEFRHGKAGIERRYDEALRGEAGLSRFEVNALGREIKELHREDGKAGADLELTIDLRLQRYVQARLAQEHSASAVVIDVHGGEILALASVPGFDPNAFTNGLAGATWQKLIGDPRAPLVNKAISGRYPPGSTFKMVVALAALEAGTAHPGHEVYCSGAMQLGSHRFHCWRRGGHGGVTLVEAIEQSCDVYFYELARNVGIDAIAAMARRFGLGQRLAVDLLGEQPGLVPDRDWKLGARGEPWQKGETLVVGIGQGYLQATPLQLAVMTARIANGGRAVLPRVVRPPYGEATLEPPESLGVSEAALDLVRHGMDRVVNGERGTARQARLDDRLGTLAGKTGTAQVMRISRSERLSGVRDNEDKPWEERDHALFVAFAPVEAPRYAVSVVVEHGGSGSKAAAPIGHDIMRRALELDLSQPSSVPTAERREPAGPADRPA